MKKSALETPAILLDLDSLEGNIKKYQEAATKAGKQVWPMTKTSKCSEIIKMQLDAGATGCLGGTLDECEAAYNLGVRDIMYAYSVASAPNIKRVLELAKKCNFTPVSYTHLDVYKRQFLYRPPLCRSLKSTHEAPLPSSP